jgi:sphinganine-1-phosphate aldolase
MPTTSVITRATALASNSFISRVKTAVFLYVILTRLLKLKRHLRARGISSSVNDLVSWFKYVRGYILMFIVAPAESWTKELTILILRLVPSQKLKLESGLKEVRADLEKKLVPQGAAIIRHTALPANGQSAEWIFAEMSKMDEEVSGHDEWRDGKISGAVYREYQFCEKYS